MTIGIRVEAGKNIATGHLMRCLAIGKELENFGFEVVFLYKLSSTKIMLNEFQVTQSKICDSHVTFIDEISYLSKVIENLQIKLIIVDGYNFGINYLNLLRRFTRICSIDDFCTENNPADIIINYNIYAIHNYLQCKQERAQRLLLGPLYTPLRKEFQNVIPRQPAKVVEDILVTTGGTDPFDVIGSLLSEVITFKEFDSIRFHAVIGPLVPDTERLKELSKHQNIILHKNVRSMSSLMVDCDLAISAGGSTLYELCRLGLPSVSVSFADNQLPAVKEFHERRIIPFCGDLRTDIQTTIEQCISYLRHYIHDYPQRLQISHVMRTLVDGKGASRIAIELKSLLADLS